MGQDGWQVGNSGSDAIAGDHPLYSGQRCQGWLEGHPQDAGELANVF